MLDKNLEKSRTGKSNFYEPFSDPFNFSSVDNNSEYNQSNSQIHKLLFNFPKTRYYGSKRRILKWIYENIKSLKFSTVLDAFGGTSTVSLLFKAMEKEVTFNDLLTCNTVSAKAILANRNSIKKNTFEKALRSVKGCNGFISKNFENIFYTDDENMWLDGAIRKINKYEEAEQNVFFYCIFQACLQKRPFNLFHRANLNLRLKDDQPRSFGNLATWNTSFIDLALKAYLELDSCIWDSKKNHTVLPAGDVCELKNGYDLVYLDPPYLSNSNTSEDYLKRYHFLEGLVTYDKWFNCIDYGSKCLSFKENKDIKKWNDKNQFRDLLFSLISFHKKSVVILSYVNNSYPSIGEISKFFEQNFKVTNMQSTIVSKALSKNKREEVLLIGIP